MYVKQCADLAKNIIFEDTDLNSRVCVTCTVVWALRPPPPRLPQLLGRASVPEFPDDLCGLCFSVVLVGKIVFDYNQKQKRKKTYLQGT